MFDKRLELEQASSVDDRMARVVRIIFEQYDGDVKAFVDAIRYRIEVNRKAGAAAGTGTPIRIQNAIRRIATRGL